MGGGAEKGEAPMTRSTRIGTAITAALAAVLLVAGTADAGRAHHPPKALPALLRGIDVHVDRSDGAEVPPFDVAMHR